MDPSYKRLDVERFSTVRFVPGEMKRLDLDYLNGVARGTVSGLVRPRVSGRKHMPITPCMENAARALSFCQRFCGLCVPSLAW